MTLQELMKSVEFEDFWPIMRDTYFQKDPIEEKEYTDEEKEKIKNIHSKVYDKMKEMELCPKDDKMVVTVMKKFDIDLGSEVGKNDKGIEIYDVSGYEAGTNEFYGIEFVDWSETLACEVCQHSIDKYGTAECMAHILWELTFCGLEPEQITKEREKLEEALHEVENEDFSNCKNWEEIKKELGFEETEETKEEIEARRALNKQIYEKNLKIREEFIEYLLAQNA